MFELIKKIYIKWFNKPELLFECVYCYKKHASLHEANICFDWDTIINKPPSQDYEDNFSEKLPDNCD